jgi:1-acyl-sn-glycerol-3-phosphate acyltransferase
MIALNADVPVCPVHVAGTYASWPKGQKKVHRVPLTVTIGKPFSAGLVADAASIGDKRVRYDAVSREIMERIAELSREVGESTKHTGADAGRSIVSPTHHD